MLIGFDAIRNLLLTTSVFDLFADRNKKKQQEQEKFWVGKRALELLGIEHEVTLENVVLNKENSQALLSGM